MTKNYSLRKAILCGLFALAPAAQAATPSITTFDCPAAGSTYASSINAAGQVTGWCSDATGTHAFVKNGATITTFDGGRPTYVSNGNSINATGQVTGYYLDGLGGNKGFVYSNGVVTLFTILNINNLPTGYMVPRSINASGQVTGEYLDIIDPTHGVYRGFIYDSAAKTSTTFDIPGAPINATVPVSINDLGQVTGTDGGGEGFVYSGGVATRFAVPNAAQTVPRTINSKGDVVGMFWDANYVASHGFIYSGGTVTQIDIPGATATDVWSINDSGQIAGYYTDAQTPAVTHGFVQTGTTVTTIDAPGSNETAVRSINASGQAAGYYVDALGLLHGFVTGAITGTVTPPSTLSCAKPKGAKSAAGKGTVTEVGIDYVVVVNLRIDYASCTHMNYGGDAKAPAVNDRIEWEGYEEPNGNVMGKTLSFN